MSTSTVDEFYPEHLRTLMQRADRCLAAAGFDALVIHAGTPPIQFLDDQDYPYKVNPHFKAWVPVVDNPGSFLLYRPGVRPRVLFNQPNDFWHKPAPMPAEAWTEIVDIEPLRAPAEAPAMWANWGRVAFVGRAEAAGDSTSTVINDANLLTGLHLERAVKTAYEIACMRCATLLGVMGHRAAHAAFLDGESEYAVHMKYLDACAQREEEMPYNNIIAFNEHAAILHYQHLERRPPASLRSLLIDAGAQYRGYASDITRTYAATPGRFAELVAATDRAQLKLCTEVVAGRDYREVHLTAHRLLGDVMHDVGLIDIGGQDAVERGLTSVFFPHGIGHLLGLQVHDVGGVTGDLEGGERKRPDGHPHLRLTRTLEPGVVVTVEPGIYMIDTLLKAAHAAEEKRSLINWEAVEELRPYGGVRIEDNVATTTSAPENMTRDAFAQVGRAA